MEDNKTDAVLTVDDRKDGSSDEGRNTSENYSHKNVLEVSLSCSRYCDCDQQTSFVYSHDHSDISTPQQLSTSVLRYKLHGKHLELHFNSVCSMEARHLWFMGALSRV
jgi:hypothetical protein